MIGRETCRQMPLLPTPIEYTSTRNLPPLLDFPIGHYEADLSHIPSMSKSKNGNDSANFSTGTSNSRSSTLSSHDFSNNFHQKYSNNNSFNNCQFHKNSGNNASISFSTNRPPVFQKSLSCGSATTNSSSGCESITTPVSSHHSPPQFTIPLPITINNFNNYCSVPSTSNNNTTNNVSQKKRIHRGIPNFIKTATLVTNEEQAKQVEISRRAEIEKSLVRKSKKKSDKLEEKLSKSAKPDKQPERKIDDSELPLNFNDKSDVAFAGNVACPDASTLPTPPREWVDAKQQKSSTKPNHKKRSKITKYLNQFRLRFRFEKISQSTTRQCD